MTASRHGRPEEAGRELVVKSSGVTTETATVYRLAPAVAARLLGVVLCAGRRAHPG